MDLWQRLHTAGCHDFYRLVKCPFHSPWRFNISLDIHGALERELVVAESIKSISNLWHSKKFFEDPDSNTSAYDFSSLPIVTDNPTTKRTSQDRIYLIRSTMGSGDKDFHVYAGQLLPRYDKSGLRMLHIDHASIRYRPHPSPPTSKRAEYVSLDTSVDLRGLPRTCSPGL